MKLSKLEIGILICYLVLILWAFATRYFITRFPDFSRISLFIVAFIPAYFGNASPIGNCFIKLKFSAGWILLSFFLVLVYYTTLEPFQIDSKDNLLRLSLLPILGYLYFQIIRVIYKAILKREPIAKFVGFGSSGIEIAHGRKSDIYDKIFTVASFFGVMIILTQLMKIKIWFL